MRFIRTASLLFLALFLIVSVTRAQDDGPVTSEADNTNTQSNTATSASASATKVASTESDTNSTPSKSASASVSASASATDAVTGDPSADATSNGAGVITDAPTVSNAIPTYPAATVPPTADAPYMQKSSLPEGTVFICVGAVLAFAFVLVLAWRAMVAYSLRRSIKRANTGYMGPVKDYSTGGVGKSVVGPFYSQGIGSTLSLDPLTGGGKSGTRNSAIPQSVKDSLFFSPTAGAGAAGGNRGSGYLPAGYYAAGASVAGGGVAGNGRPISMADFTNTRPQSSGYQRGMETDSPGESPFLHPTQRTDSPYSRLAAAGQSTASLTAKSDGRAPSAYLDDLFDYAPVQPSTERR